MKKVFITAGIILIVIVLVGGYIFWGRGTGFQEDTETLYIRSSSATREAVLDSLKAHKIVSNLWAFETVAGRVDYWKNIKPGRYEIKKGASVVSIVRQLKNGQQTPVNLVIVKFRTKEEFARLIGRRIEADSLQIISFLNSPDSLKKFQTTPETVMTNILPDTYTYYWNIGPTQLYQKMYAASQKFWTDDRVQKAKEMKLSRAEVSTLASIIEEETTKNDEKDTIASVYLNRLRINMPLQADPTVKFAVKDFALKKIAGPMLKVESPYNTYVYRGLPPGPICTPTAITIDKVLNHATTNYLYFVARPDLVGHLFSETYNEHLKKRDNYLKADSIRREMVQTP